MIALSLWVGLAEAACTVVSGAKVHLETGAQDATVVISDDRIVAIGAAEELKETSWRGTSCAAIDGKGKQLTAGLVAMPTTLGLVEVGLEQASHDDDPRTDDDPIRAALFAADAYDPLSSVIPVQRLGGITTALTVPSGGFVSGVGAVVRLDGTSQQSALIDRDALMVVNVPTGSFAEGLHAIRELVADVRDYAARPALYDTGRPFYRGASRLDLEALRPVVEGRMPVLIGANKASDLEALVRLQKELGLKLVVVGAAEGWIVADLLAAAEIPVLVDPLVYGPASFDQIRARRDNAALLHKAGVPLVIAADGTHNARTLRQLAGNAVREGLPHAAALAAITSTPARALGATDHGRIAVGAAADLVLWSGDPLELSSVPTQVWVAGRSVELTSRQTELREKYRRLPGTPAAPLSLPK
jgi:imidazolonepropionase-like amidohydrolase